MKAELLNQEQERTGLLEGWMAQIEANWRNIPEFQVDPIKLRHLAVICDGNRRAAERQGIHKYLGHRAGLEVIRGVARAARQWNLPTLTIWVASIKNLKRKELVAQGAKVVVIIGSPNSSNSKRLKEVAESAGATAYLIDDVSEINSANFEGIHCVGITSGASAPEDKVQEVIRWFLARGNVKIVNVVVADESRVTFALPKDLKML